ALKAQALYHPDVEYVIQDGEVKIVDEFTGRIMEGRRWSEGLHQAVEAKEGVKIQEEFQTLGTITLQNYFRLYEKLAGMTGTAKTEEKEFVEIYDLAVVEIPTNVGVARLDENDFIFKSKEGKFAAVVRDIEERAEKGQPVLVGTIAVETSEYLSQLLTRKGMKHKLLSRQIEGAQKKVEEQNFVMRKNVLKYDDVMNKQRMVIYKQRRDVLEGQDMSEQVKLWIDEVIEDTVNLFTEDPSPQEWD